MEYRQIGVSIISFFALLLGASAFAQGLSVTPNQPVGEGKGIFPGRVVWAMDSGVSKWDDTTGRWWDDGNIDQAILENMYEDRQYSRNLGKKKGIELYQVK